MRFEHVEVKKKIKCKCVRLFRLIHEQRKYSQTKYCISKDEHMAQSKQTGTEAFTLEPTNII